MRKTIITFVIAVIGLAGCNQSSTEVNTVDTDTKADTVAKAVVNSALQVTELDPTVFSGISEKLEKSCYRNKFGLSEEACIKVVRTRKNICTQDTGKKYPGQISSVERIQEAASNYVNCLFQK